MRNRDPNSARGLIQGALWDAKQMIGNDVYDCKFSEATRAEITLFVKTWLIPKLEKALVKISSNYVPKRQRYKKRNA